MKRSTCMALSLWQAALPPVPTLTAAPLAHGSTSVYITSVPSSQHFHPIAFVLFKYSMAVSGYAKCLGFAKNLQGCCISQFRLGGLNNRSIFFHSSGSEVQNQGACGVSVG